MQLTRAADYGIRAIVHLAGLPPDSRASLAELATASEAPEPFLTKVLQRVVAAGLIVSQRGPSGGFQLNAAAAEISLLDVVEAIEGPIQLNLCTGRYTGAPLCDRQNWCAVHLVFEQAQTKLREVLAGANLEALARDSSKRLTTIRSAAGPKIKANKNNVENSL